MGKLKSTTIKILQKIYKPILNGIVMAVVASLLVTVINEKADRRSRIRQQLTDISNIYIGCSKEWMDEHFGVPQFTSEKEEHFFCAYISDYYVIQVAFGENASAEAYSITALKNKDKKKITIHDTTIIDAEDFTLGSVTYYDLPGEPSYVTGAVSNGNERASYEEYYYMMSYGNYYNYCYASLDFGIHHGEMMDFLAEFGMPQGDIDDEVDKSKNRGIQIIYDRKHSYPNTYAVARDTDVLESLLDYDWFNSTQLRNKYYK